MINGRQLLSFLDLLILVCRMNPQRAGTLRHLWINPSEQPHLPKRPLFDRSSIGPQQSPNPRIAPRPLIANDAPIITMKIAAARSPNSRVRADTNVADIPAASSAGMVPNPKEAIMTSPLAGLSVLAAATSMAHVRPQGSKPRKDAQPYFRTRTPGVRQFRQVLAENRCLRRKKTGDKMGQRQGPKNYQAQTNEGDSRGNGKPALYCIENLCTSKELKIPATMAPSKT